MNTTVERLVTNRRPDGTLVTRPHALMDALHSIAIAHYYEAPAALSTDRTGRFEAAWAQREGSWHSVAWKPMSPRAREIDLNHMRLLVLAYGNYPDADARLLTLNPDFPQSVLLRLAFTTDAPGTYPTLSSPQMGNAA